MSSFFKKHKAGKDKKADATGEQKARADTAAAADASPRTAEGDTKPAPLLDDDDEQFLERLVSKKNEDEEEGPPPPLPPRPITPDLTWESDSESFRLPKEANAPADTNAATTTTTTTATATPLKKQNRLSRLFSRKSAHPNSLTVPGTTTKDTTTDDTSLTTPAPVPPEEADREWADLNRVLARLDLTTTAAAASTASAATKAKSATKSAALTASAEVQSLLRQFVLVLRDIMRGAPTAVDDLVALLDGRNDALKRGFEKLPRSMQKLVTQLPKKLTSALGPEVLLAAAEAQGLKRDSGAAAAAAAGKGKGGVAKFLVPRSLGELALTPAIVKSMLRAIVNALKVRWPAFVGTNVLWSAAVFLLLFVLWYCHKRGKEEREKAEKEGMEVDGEGRVLGEVVEEEDGSASAAVVVVEPPAESPRS